jgi:hypothetical protein
MKQIKTQVLNLKKFKIYILIEYLTLKYLLGFLFLFFIFLCQLVLFFQWISNENGQDSCGANRWTPI